MAAKLSSITDFEYDLSDKQHVKLTEIVRSVNKGSKAIEELSSRGDQLISSECNPLREVWCQNVVERLEYECDQWQNSMCVCSLHDSIDDSIVLAYSRYCNRLL